jgi:hypothetical protein
MNHPVTQEIRILVEEIHGLRQVIEVRLALASAAARDEWDKLCARIPRREELEAGLISLCVAELEEMRSKIARFAQILRGLGDSLVRFTTPPQGVVVMAPRRP